MKSMKLNLGCGKDIKPKEEGRINLDFIKRPGVDVVHDLNKYPWPFNKDNSFDEIYCSHILEHLENFQRAMSEIKRICKNKAKVIIRVPHFSCGVSYRDPTHKRFFSYFTFDYFEREEYNLPKFKVLSKKLNFTRFSMTFLNYIFNPIINLNPAIYERFFCWIFPCSEVIVELEVLK